MTAAQNIDNGSGLEPATWRLKREAELLQEMLLLSSLLYIVDLFDEVFAEQGKMMGRASHAHAQEGTGGLGMV